MSLLEDTLALVRVDSVSGREGELAGLVHSRLRGAPHLDVERVGDNVVASTRGHHARRVIIAGHIDTVPGDARAGTIDGDRVVGLGACDMKGSVAIMLDEAVRDVKRSLEVTWIFYAREEIARSQSGLLELAQLRPDLLVADAALLAEPTGGVVEAGCQGTLRVVVTVTGARAHTARPFTGRNAIHRLAPLLSRIANYEPREAVIDGILYTEQLQVVRVEGGVANNVVPDEARITLNHRIAPDRGLDDAATSIRDLLADLIEPGDQFEIGDYAPPAAPSLDNPFIARLVDISGVRPRAKVGWTDVATFAERGVPAANFGAGDPLLAHRSDEFVTLEELGEFQRVLRLTLE